MQMDEANRRRAEWEAKGSPSCDHPSIDREFYLGSHTGDWACHTCGETFTRNELRQMGR